ncbi:Adaptive-response sensory-kinase SasA [Neolewinella maritima]|uniref:histidine kinase n=1 Tax=Neolewinella maritima TaxID=1383882 RepID=A0ABM9B1M7_9BACT|nr:HAMP domain-containing sensor histidine kinase [Neolewinella maritima]CAH1000754.1 Adaptive-response sensory-kinase SasA [Neolewinella maritima]
MHHNVIRRVIVLGLIAILGIIGMQTYWVATTWNLNDTEFSQKAQLALYGVARQLAAENDADLPKRDIVRQRSSNYFIVNTESEINAQRLEYLMQQELQRLHLDVDFEYAIFDCSTNEMAYGGYCTAESQQLPTDPETGSYLPPDEGLLYYFGVKFPTRVGYIWQKMQLVVFLSVILILTVAFFAYSLLVILRQRRLATMQKEFIDNMTHEFKTPLSTIRIAAGVLARDPHVAGDARLSRYAQLIHAQYQRLNEQVENVLQIASTEKGGFTLRRERIDLQELLPPLLSSARARTEERDGHLSWQLPDRAVPLYADPLHLTNILHSLLDNAIKYGGTPPRIAITGHVADRHLHLSIHDDGPGIAAEHQERVFEKFYRVPTGDVHDVKGFGLGLYYVRQICRAHGWNIRVESAPGYGTALHLRLPLTPVPQAAVPA